MEKTRIRISESLIKAIKRNQCPRKIERTLIKRDARKKPTGICSLSKGLYFEYKCLSPYIGRKDDMVFEMTDLKRNANGSMKANHVRIDQQVNVFHKVRKEYECQIGMVWPRLTVELDELKGNHFEYYAEGTPDFMGSMREDDSTFHERALHDIKLTGNIYSQYGDWSWHFPANMDHTQAFHYVVLWKIIFKEDIPFFYWVFDYKTEPEYKIIKKTVSQLDIAEYKRDMINTIEFVEKQYKEYGWEPRPSYDNCRDCPLKESCEVQINKKKIEIF